MTPAYAELLARRDGGIFPSLVRGDDGNLHLRRFRTAADAAQASHSHSRERAEPMALPIPTKPGRDWTPAQVAHELGISKATVLRALDTIAHRKHGPKTIRIPGSEVNLIKQHGLLGLRQLRRA